MQESRFVYDIPSSDLGRAASLAPSVNIGAPKEKTTIPANDELITNHQSGSGGGVVRSIVSTPKRPGLELRKMASKTTKALNAVSQTKAVVPANPATGAGFNVMDFYKNHKKAVWIGGGTLAIALIYLKWRS